MCSTDGGDRLPHGDQTGTGTFLANFRQPGPWGWKLQRMFVNIGIKVVRRQRCCGHGGEPGC